MSRDSYKRLNTVILTADVLQFVAQHGPCSAYDVADGVEVPFSTVMCHLKTMEDLGWLRMVGGHFDIGPKLAVFWAAFRRRAELKVAEGKRDLEQVTA